MTEQEQALAFIQRWQGVTASELATSQSFAIALCELLGVERPHPGPEQRYEFDLSAAIERARRENKRLYLYLSASDCPFCRKYEAFLDRHADELLAHFAKDYLVYEDERYTYAEVHAQVRKLAAHLVAGFIETPEWRVYTLRHPREPLYIHIADSIAYRQRLVLSAMLWLLLPLLGVLPLLAWLVRAPTPWRRAVWLGWAFATAWLAATFWWLFISMHTYGGLAAPLASAAVLGLAAFLGTYYAVALGLFARLAPTHRALAAIVFAALWLLAELARGTLWTGFPWGAGGYAHVQGPLSALARTVGVYGVGFVAAVLAMLLAQARTRDLRSLRAWALVAGGALVLVGAGLQRQCAIESCHTPARQPSAPISLALLQGNIPQNEKFEAGSGVPMALQWYADVLVTAKASLVVAPETAVPLLPFQLKDYAPGYWDTLVEHFKAPGRAALVGVPLGDFDTGYRQARIRQRLDALATRGGITFSSRSSWGFIAPHRFGWPAMLRQPRTAHRPRPPLRE